MGREDIDADVFSWKSWRQRQQSIHFRVLGRRLHKEVVRGGSEQTKRHNFF